MSPNGLTKNVNRRDVVRKNVEWTKSRGVALFRLMYFLTTTKRSTKLKSFLASNANQLRLKNFNRKPTSLGTVEPRARASPEFSSLELHRETGDEPCLQID